ncbi:TLDc domain-containing protein [Entamoeba marina]
MDSLNQETQLQKFYLETLKNWCGLNKIKVIFDSDIDGDGSGTLARSIAGLGSLYFITFDDNNNVFGGFLSSMAKLEQTEFGLQMPAVTDSNCFLFSLIRDGSTDLRKWDVNTDGKKRVFHCNYRNSQSDELYAFGMGRFLINRIGVDSTLGNLGSCFYDLNTYETPNFDNNCHVQRILVLKMRW